MNRYATRCFNVPECQWHSTRPIVPRMIRGIIAVAGIIFVSLDWANTGLFAQFSSGVQLIEVYATVTDA
jgi:hypothetical protein